MHYKVILSSILTKKKVGRKNRPACDVSCRDHEENAQKETGSWKPGKTRHLKHKYNVMLFTSFTKNHEDIIPLVP